MNRLTKITAFGLFCAVVIIASSNRSAADDSGYQTPTSFMNLYKLFSSAGGESSIGLQLAQAMAAAETLDTSGPLIVVTGTGLYVYDDTSRELVAEVDFRLNPATGFFEMTAISHIGPAVSYLARMKELGDSRWSAGVDALLADISAVRATNAAEENNWLDRLDLEAWAAHRDEIQNMVDYACYMAGSYLKGVKQGDGSDFTVASVATDFLDLESEQFPISYNAVMVATFMLVALEDSYKLQTALADKEIDWSAARVVMRMEIGSNITAGLTAGTLSMYQTLRLVASGDLPHDRIFIAPYAEEKSTLGEAVLPQEDFDYYAVDVWERAYSRSQTALEIFSHIETVYLPQRPPLPGDYDETDPDDIEAFMVRMKHSLTDVRELLSNSVGFWMPNELADKNWNPAEVAIPGLTHGLPEGVEGYPADSPAL